MNNILTLAQAGELLQLSTRTIVKLAVAGIIPGRKIGAQWRFLRTDLEEYVHGGTKQAAS